MIGIYPEIYISSFRMLPAFHQTNEEGSLISLGLYLPKAFKEIKEYLTHPPVQVAPISGKSFLLYVQAMDYSLGGLLAQNYN